MGNLKKVSFKYLSNNWIVTLTATLIGVFAALYLNEVVETKKLNNKKSIATKNIFLEVEANQESLEKSIKKLEMTLKTIAFLKPRMNDDGELIASPDSMTSFKSKYPEVFKVEDSIKLENGKYNYIGEADVDFNISSINLTTLSLSTLKNSGLTSYYNFNCLMNLERLEKFTIETLESEKQVLNSIYKTVGDKEAEEEFTTQIKLLLSYEKTLLVFYKEAFENLKKCD
jgi:hypothetical protein